MFVLTLTTPGGQPISLSNSMSMMVAPGSLSEGLMTMVFPAINANGNIHKGIIAGKLNGQIPAVTPNGSLYETMSISLEMFWSDSPWRSVPAAQLCSTTSRRVETLRSISYVV